MTTRLYYYRLMPGDPNHVPAYYWSAGIVAAEPDEIAAIVDEVEARHYALLQVTPVEDKPETLAQFREAIGSAITLYHYVEDPRARLGWELATDVAQPHPDLSTNG